jgi:hypothetical protein
MRMRKFGRFLPAVKLKFGAAWIDQDEFYGGLAAFLPNRFGQENGAALGATQVFPQMEFGVDNLPFPMFPGVVHFDPPPASPTPGRTIVNRFADLPSLEMPRKSLRADSSFEITLGGSGQR